MAQVKLLKINGDGTSTEFQSATDDITLNSFSIQGGGPVLSGTGLALANQDLSAIKNLVFTAPNTDTINQTAGALIVDNIVAKERSNLFSTAGEVLFPIVTDTASTVDNFRLPQLAGAPTATPTNTGSGFQIWDTANNKQWVWSGSAWLDQSLVNQARALDDTYTAAATLVATDAVYISAANTVDKAKADVIATSYALGFATAGAVAAAQVDVRKAGVLGGFSSLTPGARYFLSGTTAGQITSTVPTGLGHTIVQVGLAKSATQLDIIIQTLGRRAS
jgi:hypothetical protein